MRKVIKVKYSILGLICCIFTYPYQSKSQQTAKYQYKKPPVSLFTKSHPNAFRYTILNSEKGAYDVTKALPSNYVKDATVDYTSYLQNAINLHDNIVMPDFPILVNSIGLKVKSNSTIIFKPHSKLMLQANDKSSYAVMAVYNVENVNIYNPQIVGDRDQHTDTKGEWGMGISIRGSKNVEVVNPIINSCWGDGIYISDMSQNIKIYNAKLDNNRRNGISVISADHLLIQSPVISNTNGTYPMSGIDIEPDTNADELKSIDIENPVTYNNAQQGILISVDRLSGQQTKQIGIKINNHVDMDSNYGFGFHNLTNTNGKQPFEGNINVINPRWKSRNEGIQHYNSFKGGIQFNLQNVQIIKKSENGIAQTVRPSSDSLTRPLH